MEKVEFRYIRTGTGELSGPSLIKQTELAINDLGGFMEGIEGTAEEALDIANKARRTAENAQTTADTALSQAQEATGLADQARQSADSAQATANEALEKATDAGESAAGKAPVMHASKEDTYGAGTDVLLGHIKLSDSVTGTEQASNGKTAATPYSVSRVNTNAENALAAAAQAGQVANGAQESANKAQQTAENAQDTADTVQSSLEQYVENFNQQITILINARFFQVQAEAIDAAEYVGRFAKLYLTVGASASTGLPFGVTYPLYFWTEKTEDSDAAMMYVLSGNVLWSQVGVNTTPDAEEDSWQLSGWKRITYGPATEASLGVVKPDGTTTMVSDDGTISINKDMLGQVYKFKGSVATKDDLPTGATVGDVYNVTDTGVNYGWTGTEWDSLGGIEMVDSIPVQGSENPVSSGGVYTALADQKAALEEQIGDSVQGAVPNSRRVVAGNGLTGGGALSADVTLAVKLTDSVSSTDSTTAASAKAVKTAYDLANSKQANLGFTPVQQGGGAGQEGNKIYIGWSAAGLKAQVDAIDLGNIVTTSAGCTKAPNAATADLAGVANRLRRADGVDTIWNWAGQSGQPSYVWGSNDGINMLVWNPANFSVAYANSAGMANVTPNAVFVGNNGQIPPGGTWIFVYMAEDMLLHGIFVAGGSYTGQNRGGIAVRVS